MISQETTFGQLSEQLADYGLRLGNVHFNPRESPEERCSVRLVGVDDNQLFYGMGIDFVDAVNDALGDVEAAGVSNA